MGASRSKDRMTGGRLEAAPPKICKVIKVRHAGGYVEEFDRPVMTQEVMELHARHWVTQRDIFKAARSHSSVLPPHTLLEPGHTYFLVPFHTLYRRLLRQAIPKPDLLAFLSQQGLSPAEFYTHLRFKPNPGSTHRLTGKTKRGSGLSQHDRHHHYYLKSTAYHQKGAFNDDKTEPTHGGSKKKRPKVFSDHDSNHDLNRTNHISSADHQKRALINYGINGADYHKKASSARRHPASFHKMESHENAFKANHNCTLKRELNQKAPQSLQNNADTSNNQLSTINPKDGSTPVMIKSAQTKHCVITPAQTKHCVITPANKLDSLAYVALESNQQQAGSTNTKTFDQGTLKALKERGSLKSRKDQRNPGFETNQESLLCEKQGTQNAIVNTIKPPSEPKRSEALMLQCVPQKATLRQPQSLLRSRSVHDHAEMQRQNHVDQLITNAECSQSDVLNLINRNAHLQNTLNEKQQKERSKSLSSFIGQATTNPEIVITKSLRELMIQSPLKIMEREGDYNHNNNEISDHDSTHVDKYKSSTVAKCDQEITDNLSDQTPHVDACMSNQQRTICLRKLQRRLGRCRFRSGLSWEPSLKPVHEYSSD